jgi:hypothetical protein
MESTSKIPTKQAENKTSEENFKVVLQKLTSIDKKSRPKSETKLKNHIKSILCLKELTPTVDEIYQQLLNSKKIYFNQAKQIEYAF